MLSVPTFLLAGCLFILASFSFVQSDKKTLVLPKMPPDRRKFVQEVNPSKRIR
jgi:hypothetical protein